MQSCFLEGEQVTHSFISSFKPLLIALVIIGTIEGSIALHTGGRALFDSNFLELAFARAENPNKILLEIKKFYSPEFKPYFLQVGDSSGFHGMKAKLLDKVFPNKPYLVLSCCGDMGYAGHRYVAAAALDELKSVHYLIYYVSPFSTPSNFAGMGQDLADSYYSAFVNPWHHLNPPSLAFRLDVTNFFYHGFLTHDFAYNKAALNKNYVPERHQWFVENNGWAPRPPNGTSGLAYTPPPPLGACYHSPQYSAWARPAHDGSMPIDSFYPELAATAKLVREKHVQLILVFNPVSCVHGDDILTLRIEREIARFRADFPEVIVPFDFINTWAVAYFRDPWHMTEEGAEKMANEFGPLLRKIVSDPSFRGVPAQTVSAIDADIARRMPQQELEDISEGNFIKGMEGTPGASNFYEKAPPSALMDGTYAPWGSAETTDDTYFWITLSHAGQPQYIALMPHLDKEDSMVRDVRVVAGWSADGQSPKEWHFIHARIKGETAWSEKLTIPRKLQGPWVLIAINPNEIKGKGYDAFGLACLSKSKSDKRNYILPGQGNGIYVRELRLLKQSESQ